MARTGQLKSKPAFAPKNQRDGILTADNLPHIDVTDFPYYADPNAGDNSAAFAAAFAAGVAARRAVYIPHAGLNKGYVCASGVTINLPDNGSYLRVYGDGLGSYLHFTGAGADGITIDNTFATAGAAYTKAQVSFEDFAIGGAAGTRDMLVLQSSCRGTFKNVWVTGGGRRGIYLAGSLLNTFIGGGVSHGGVGSPGGFASATPVIGVEFASNIDISGSDGNVFLGFVVEALAQGTKAIASVGNVTPIQITTAAAHGYATGDVVAITGTGVTAINGQAYEITVTGADTFTLDGTTASGAGGAAGTVEKGTGYYFRNSSYGNTIVGGNVNTTAVGVFMTDDCYSINVVNCDVDTTALWKNDSSQAGTNSYFSANSPTPVIGGATSFSSAGPHFFGPDVSGGARLGIYRPGGGAYPVLFCGRTGGGLTLATTASGAKGRLSGQGDVDNGSGSFEAFAWGSAGGAPQLGFYGAALAGKPTVSGSALGNAALIDLLAELATLGILTNSATLTAALQQGFLLTIQNDGGTIKHGISSTYDAASDSNYASKINGATRVLTATPTVGPGTPFAAGGGITAAATHFILHTPVAQVEADAGLLNATVEYNSCGTAVTVTVRIVSSDVNGVTLLRPWLLFSNATTGAAFALTVGNIAAGKAICVKITGPLY